MKPKIGVFGGRYFVSGKKSYTMNQITEKFSKNVSPDLGRVIFEKDAQATALLKNGNCFQKMLTTIKQKNGNRQFKNHFPKFVGKKAVLQAFEEASRRATSETACSARFRTGNFPPVPLQPLNSTVTLEKDPPQELTPVEKVQKLIEAKNFSVALWSITSSDVPKDEQKRCYYELVEAYRKQENFNGYFGEAVRQFKRWLPDEYQQEIYRQLAYNHCKEAKDDYDYRIAGEFMLAIGPWEYDDVFLDVAQAHMIELNFEKALKVLSLLSDKNSERAQEIYAEVEKAKAKI
jgi:hypothetical protein